jgi:hypothetical protein
LGLLAEKLPALMTITQAAALFHRSRETIRRAMRAAGVEPFAPGGTRGPKLLTRDDCRAIRRALKDFKPAG